MSTPSHRHQLTTPIPIKQRHRSSFSQVRKRRPSDAAVLHVEDRDRLTSSKLQALSLSPQAQPISKSAPGGEDGGHGHGHSGKKKSTIFRCETCAKAYRHPSCLVKHRWEHSPHWREASKFLLSKHQQVQLLEAAAILSHLSPTKSGGGTSLPEDRSLWPSYLSGGLLPMPTANVHVKPVNKDNNIKEDSNMSTSSDEESDVETPPSTTDKELGGGVAKSMPTLTQFRPGLLGHPNLPLGTEVSAAPIPVPGGHGAPGGAGVGPASWGSQPPSSASASAAGSISFAHPYPQSFSYSYTSSHTHAFSHPHIHSYAYSSPGTGNRTGTASNGIGTSLALFEEHIAGRSWSLPRSSVRSGSVEESDVERGDMDDDEEVDVVGMGVEAAQGKVAALGAERDADEWDMEMDT